MAQSTVFETAYKSLLQGVSQQPAEARLPGQVSAQLNMQSDPVTNLRRRYGCRAVKALDVASSTESNIRAWYMDIAGALVHVIINTSTGVLRVYDSNWNIEGTLTDAYLSATESKSIRIAPVGNELFIANTEVLPVAQYSTLGQNPANIGFFYVTAGAFSKSYSVLINRAGTLPYTVTYTTPDGTGVGDAALSVPEYIADQLVQGITGNDGTIEVYRDGPYVFLRHSDALVVNSSTGKNYMIVSKASAVLDLGELPARLPPEGDGYNCRVGVGDVVYYYQYHHSTSEWLESRNYGGPSSIKDAPISLYWTGTAWALNTSDFDGRLAGDDTSNPAHEWIEYGITGLGTYQGRLVILSGPMASLSASNKPRKFFRTTVSTLLHSDPIEVGANAVSAAAYEWCLPFQKDLVLFSATNQAVLPSGNVGVTPQTATVVPTSAYATDIACEPVVVGRTVMYSKPRSADFFGVLELVPSSYTDSQYMSQDVTQHIPLYMPGRCRFCVSSSTASMAMFASTTDPYSLIVHEYFWDGDQKVQQAWHTWTMPYKIASAYFSVDRVVLLLVNAGNLLVCTVDPRQGSTNSSGDYTAYLDLQIPLTYSGNEITIPGMLITFDPNIGEKLSAVVGSGDDRGDLLGTEYNSGTGKLDTVASHESGDAVIGIPYRSSVVLTPPVLRDRNDSPVYTGKLVVTRYNVNTSDSTSYKIMLSTDSTNGDPLDLPTLYMDSADLQLGHALDAKRSTAVVPARIDARQAHLEIFTDGAGPLTIQSVEYLLRHHAMHRRGL